VYQLTLPEPADPYVEALLAGEVCPVHVGTTLDGGVCAVCELDARLPWAPPENFWDSAD
jgi:hypothetical protein